MRKKFFLLALVTMLLPLLANAVEINGICYRLKGNATATVTYRYLQGDGYYGNIIIPSSFVYDGVEYTVTEIGERAFHSSELSSITIPSSIKHIAHDAFSSRVENIYITDIAKWCEIDFDNDNFHNGNPMMLSGCHLFLNGQEVKDLVIPEGVTCLSRNTFYGLSEIESVTIPSSVTYFEENFDNCTGIKDVICLTEAVPVRPGREIERFPEDVCRNAVLHVRGSLIDEYKDIKPWKYFKDIQAIEGTEVYNLIYMVDSVVYKTYEKTVGDNVGREADPTKEGYTFSGWSEIPETMPDHDVVITGKFIPNLYTLTCYVDGDVYAVYDVECGAEICLEPDPVRKGMTFNGWRYAPKTMPACDFKLYGTFSWSKLTQDAVVYQVTDTLENSAAVVGNDKISVEIKIATYITFDYDYAITSIADKAFYARKDVTSVEIPATMKSIGERAFANIDKLNSVTIYADDVPETDRTAFENSYIEDYVTLHVPGGSINKYKETAPWKNFKEIVAIAGTESVQTYKLTYMVDGEVYETFDVNEGESITPESEPTKEGYTFSGWSEIPSTMPGNNVTVTGTFTVNKYKLTYMVDGTEYKTIEVEYGSTITPEDNPTMDGYTFSGWSDIPDTMPASDVVVTGTFSKGSYTLTYILDGVTYKTYTYGYDESITPESVPEKEGYTFTGWVDLPNTMPGHDVTVTGSYTINKYKLIYMVDGEVYMTIEVEYGASITPEDEPTKDGYVFSGWSWIPSKMPAEDVTISGTFKQVGYNINDNIYVVDGGYATLAKGNSTGDVVISPTIVVDNITYDVVTIGQYAFSNNTEITSVTIPDGITIIGDNAFYGCSGIEKLTMGKDIWKIGSKAFAYIGTSASARKRASSEPLVIECHAESVPDAQYDSFEGIDIKNVILKVNDNLVDSYKKIYPWNQFMNIVGFNAPTDIHSIYSGENGDSIFSIDGRKIDKPQKGMNIIRTSQGTRKVMVK